MHKPTSSNFMAVYVEFTGENLVETTEGLRYKYQDYWYLIDEDTEFVYA